MADESTAAVETAPAPQGSPNESSAAASNVAPEVDLPPTSEGGDTYDWSVMGNPSLDDVVEDVPSPGPGAAAVPPTAPAPVVQQVAPQQPQVVPQVTAPQAAPQVPPVQYQAQPSQLPQQPAQEAPVAPQAPRDITEVLQMFTQHGNLVEEAIAQSEYQLTQADKDALETDAVAYIPKLLARAQLGAMKGTLHYVQNFLPTLISTQVSTMVRQAQAEQSFLKDFPHLSDPKYRNEIIKTGQALRGAYPQLPQGEFIRLVGQVLSMRYPAPAGSSQAQPGAQQRVQQVPFAPAVPQGRAPIPQVPQAIAGDDWFNGLGANYDEQ